jgi:hypothetical protein
VYRDSVSRPDEHDRAVGAIQIADGLIVDCLAALTRLRGSDKPERWAAARALHDQFPEIWTQLDTARRVLAGRGANTTGYDELRRHVNPVLSVSHLDGSHEIDGSGLDDARRGLDELKLSMPGADWRAIDARTKGLVRTSIVRGGQRVVAAGVFAAFAFAVTAWASALVPNRRVDRGAEMQRELATVVVERQARIAQLGAVIGDRCDAHNVHELMKLLVMDGRWQDARAYGETYQGRCGDDPIVEKWASAPRPPGRR